MKRFLLVGLVVLVIGLLIASFTMPTLAHGPADEDSPASQESWEAMHQACEEGDWEAMAEAAEEAHCQDFNAMPCHGEGNYSSPDGEMAPSSGWGGMMGNGWGGMMGNGRGGMMGSGGGRGMMSW
jgi:hypothetical protein